MNTRSPCRIIRPEAQRACSFVTDCVSQTRSPVCGLEAAELPVAADAVDVVALTIGVLIVACRPSVWISLSLVPFQSTRAVGVFSSSSTIIAPL